MYKEVANQKRIESQKITFEKREIETKEQREYSSNQIDKKKYESRGKVVQERMKIMCQTNDGFAISEKDLELRGSGDFFGTAQHGIPEMKIANLFEDIDVLKTVQDLSNKIMSDDLNLSKPQNERLKNLVKGKLDGRIDI